MFGGPEVSYHQTHSARYWLSILRTPHTTQNLQRKRKNKRLHTPWTTDRLHTRQDRWIQKELAFTPAKNVTKPNPFKIIPLQPTRKENNWETEEMMDRATVTLETEQAKWPNPGCLWWWWFLSFNLGFILRKKNVEKMNERIWVQKGYGYKKDMGTKSIQYSTSRRFCYSIIQGLMSHNGQCITPVQCLSAHQTGHSIQVTGKDPIQILT